MNPLYYCHQPSYYNPYLSPYQPYYYNPYYLIPHYPNRLPPPPQSAVVDGHLIIDDCNIMVQEPTPTSFSNNVHVDGEVAIIANDLTHDLPVSTGLTKKQISRNLKPFIKIYHKDKDEDEDEDCAICLSELEENKRAVVLTCKHTYHVNCIQEWLETQNVCPLCKRTALRVFAN